MRVPARDDALDDSQDYEDQGGGQEQGRGRNEECLQEAAKPSSLEFKCKRSKCSLSVSRGLERVLLHLAALEAYHAFAWITPIHLGAKD